MRAQLTAHYLDVDGCLSFALDEGSGPPVVCLHTAGQNGVQWRHVQSQLAGEGYRVIVPDLPGHGRSEPHPSGPIRDLGDYGAWVGSLIDALDLDSPFIVGCSIGGRISLDLAVRRGDRLRGVVAMAAHGGPAGPSTGISVSGLERELNDVAAPSRSDRTYFGTRAVVGRSVPEETREMIALMHRREDPVISNSDLIGWATFDVLDRLPDVKCPVHIVVGEDDLWVESEVARRSAEAMPRGRYSLLKGIGHYPMEEMSGSGSQISGWLREMDDQ